MQARPFSFHNDYATLQLWWAAHGWEAVPPDHLPEVGFIINDLVAGFIYKTDSAFCWLEFIISNPDSHEDERSRALDCLLHACVEWVSKSRFKTILSTIKHKRLIEHYKQVGFIQADTEMSTMLFVKDRGE